MDAKIDGLLSCCPSEIYVKGRSVRVTPALIEMALLIYEARPFVMASSQTMLGGQSIGQTFELESAPAFYQHEILELAHAAMQHPAFAIRTLATGDTEVERAVEAMRNAELKDGEGNTYRLFDLLDFSGENKAHVITRQLAIAALRSTGDTEAALSGDVRHD